MRLAGRAVAGYFPTPLHLVQRIAALVEVRWGAWEKGAPSPWGRVAVADPCAGDGAAVLDALLGVWADEAPKLHHVAFYGCELERSRARSLADRAHAAVARAGGEARTAQADALRFRAEDESRSRLRGATVLWGNPPYDVDAVYGRLEERFLRAWAPRVAPGGAIVWIVPASSLAASADTLARHFEALACFRFPPADFAAFKQVVVVGRARPSPLRLPDSLVRLQVQVWAADPASIPELPERPRPAVTVTPTADAGFSAWEAAPLNVAALVNAHAPWSETVRGRPEPTEIQGMLPAPSANLLRQEFPVVVPPRPSHIAAALAAGVYSGAEVAPDDPASGLPPALLKATFNREYVPVERKTDKAGRVMAVLEAQVPRLTVTALDLRALTFHELAPGIEPSGAPGLDGSTAGDLLARYGRSLLGVLRDRCPVLHDPQRPGDAVPLPPVRRALFRAQAEAAMACVKVLDRGDGSRPLLLGELGSGKSSCALQVAVARGARSVLVLCPPHLLDGWGKQIAAVWGDVVPHRAFVLDSLQDVDAYAAWRADPVNDGLTGVAILSREKAKLGHGWASVLARSCPRCGSPLGPEKCAGERARRRMTCEARPAAPANEAARVAESVAVALAPAWFDEAAVADALPLPLHRMMAAAWPARAKRLADPANPGAPDARSRAAAEAAARPAVAEACWSLLLELKRANGDIGRDVFKDAAALRDALFALASAAGEGAAVGVAERFAADPWPPASEHRALSDHAAAWSLAKGLLLLARSPDARERAAAVGLRLDAAAEASGSLHLCGSLTAWLVKRDVLRGVRPLGDLYSDPWHYLARAEGGGVRVNVKDAPGPNDPRLALWALERLGAAAAWADAPACGERLYEADGSPRRVPLATYIARRHPRLFDFLVSDEAHEVSSDESAQGRAASRLIAKVRESVHLTGSSSNGYSTSLFTTLWHCSPAFRREFKRGDLAPYRARYGLSKRKLQHVDRDGKVVEYGSHSDRVTVREVDAGEAPGVLPTLILRHVLAVAVTLQKADLALELPPHEEIPVPVAPTAELAARHLALADAVIAQARKDSHTPLAGKLLGAVARLPTHPDRAAAECGNEIDDEGAEGVQSARGGGPQVDPGSYVVRYPATAGPFAGTYVAHARPLPSDEVLPKETRVVEIVRAELAEGRRVMVLGYHARVLPRLQRILAAALGEPVALLRADRVAPAKREAWIDREVIGRGVRVLVVNPVAVATGLNNLVWFHTQVWAEGPNCNPVVYDQVSGRIDRIGKTLPTRSYFLFYELPTQRAAHRLLMHKVGVLRGVDGLDAEGALAAAGAGADLAFAGMSLGRELYAMLTAGA